MVGINAIQKKTYTSTVGFEGLGSPMSSAAPMFYNCVRQDVEVS
jgi:hypothetical protein